MSEDKALAQLPAVTTTKVRGYFNPNSYPVTIPISELGLNLLLQPNDYILERGSQRKINDPILDRFVGRFLSAEISRTPVPIVALPKMVPSPHSQHVVGQGTRNAEGKWEMQPAATAVAPMPVAPSVSKPSVMAMSMDEARKLGLVGRTRPVPEDFGATETDGAPMRGDNIPTIKYAMESAAPNARPGALPQELLEQVQPKAVPLIAGLQAAANANPEAVNLGRRAAEQAVAAQQGETGVQQFRAARKAIRSTAPRAVVPPPPPVAAPAPAPAPALPEPLVAAGPAAPEGVRQPRRRIAVPMPPPSEVPIMGGRPEEAAASVVEAAVVSGPAPGAQAEVAASVTQPNEAAAPAGSGADLVCGGCGKHYPYKSYLRRHIERAHKDRLQELMPK